MVWPRFKIFRFSKGNPTGHSEGKKKKEADRRREGQTISKSGQEWTLPVQLGQLKTGRWKGVVAISSMVPRRPSKVMGRNRIEIGGGGDIFMSVIIICNNYYF